MKALVSGEVNFFVFVVFVIYLPSNLPTIDELPNYIALEDLLAVVKELAGDNEQVHARDFGAPYEYTYRT